MNTRPNGGFQFLRLTWKLFWILSHVTCDVPESSLKEANLDYTAYFSSFPTNVATFANDSATIDCVVILNATTGKNVSVYWTKNGNNIDKVIQLNSRYQLSQERNKSGTANFSLTIANATVEDEGVFQCYLQFINATGENLARVTIESSAAYFNVEIAPTPPEISPESPMKTSNGQRITLTCKSAGRPRPMLSWYDTNNKKILEGVTQEGAGVYHPLYKVTSDHLFPVKSELTFRVEAHHHMKNITCVQMGTSSSPATREKLKETKAVIQIQVSPEILHVNQSYFDAVSTTSSTSERTDYNYTISAPASTGEPKESGIGIVVYDSSKRDLGMEIGVICAGVFLVVIFISLLVTCCVKYYHQGNFNVTL